MRYAMASPLIVTKALPQPALNMTSKLYRLGLVSASEYEDFEHKYREADGIRRFLKDHRWNPREVFCRRLSEKLDAESIKGVTLEELLRRPGIVLEDFRPLLQMHDRWPDSLEVGQSVEIEVRYEGYIQQQLRDAEKIRRAGARRIPEDFDYAKIDGLNREIREKLSRVKPRDLAMAGRIPGVTPAAIAILNIQLELRQQRQRASAKTGAG